MFKKIRIIIAMFILAIVGGVGVPYGLHYYNSGKDYLNSIEFKMKKAPAADATKDLADQDPTLSQVMSINKNKASFTKDDLNLDDGSWQTFSNLDSLNRVGVANAMLGKDLMPTKKREPLDWNPTGFHNKKIGDKSDSGWLYDRSHLIGYQLTGENNNPKNLMTGTRKLNTPYMERFENDIAKYIKSTGHHVRYRVTPIFKANELVARGVQMEGQSVEDKTINFNAYILNIQDGVTIDYTTGFSSVNSF